jgi:hypothetical protein
MAPPKQGSVFISCGQYREEEIALGRALAETISEFTAFEGYFAQNQTSLDGLSRHIFRALSLASGFVAVMHHRGEVETLNGRQVRASVWIEQEIAIAAFLRQTMDRDLPVVVYIQKGIHREGVRDQLLLGAVEFETEAEVLKDFTKRLMDGTFVPKRPAQPKSVELHIDFKTVSRQQDYHAYQLGVFVKNTGTEPLTEYWLDLQFPRAVLDSSTTYAAEVPDRRTHNQMLLRCTHKQTRRELYPGDEIVLLTIDYHMDHDLYEGGQMLKETVTACFGAPGMPTVRVEKPFRDLQEF